MREKDLKMNVKKTKVFGISDRTVAMESSTFPCSVCRRGAGRNFYEALVGEIIICLIDSENRVAWSNLKTYSKIRLYGQFLRNNCT